VQHAFRDDIIALWKQVPEEDRSYDAESKTWVFPWDYYRTLLRRVTRLALARVIALPESLVPA